MNSDTAAENIIPLLQERGYRLDTLLENKKHSRIGTVRLNSNAMDNSPIIVDIFFCASGIEDDVVKTAETVNFAGIKNLRIASKESLIAMKVLSYDPEIRPRDLEDLIHLIAEISNKEIAHCQQLITRIVARGFNRNRDLLSLFEQMISLYQKARD